MFKLFLSAVLAALLVVVPANAGGKHAHNLSDAEKAIRSTEGKGAFSRSMVGTDNTMLGEPLPQGITRDELSHLVFGTAFDKLKKDDLSGLAAVPYPGRPGLFVGAGGIKVYADSNCANSYVHLSLIVFKMDAPHKFVVVAKTAQPLQFDQGGLRVAGRDPNYPEDELVKIDRSPFQIAQDQFAFGIRLAHNVGYAGGTGYAEFLHLFVIDGATIRPVFSTLIYDLQNLAGDWNKDQTRQHIVYENKYVVAVNPAMKAGYHDLAVRQSFGGRYSGIYKWDTGSKSYESAGKEAIIFSDNQ